MKIKKEDADAAFGEPLRISPEQCRAARGLLGWSQTELANRAGITLSTVKNFEVGRSNPIRLSMKAMEDALARGGIRFIFETNEDGDRLSIGVYAVWELGPIDEDRTTGPVRIIPATEDKKPYRP